MLALGVKPLKIEELVSYREIPKIPDPVLEPVPEPVHLPLCKALQKRGMT